MRGLQSRSRTARVFALLPWLLIAQTTPGVAADLC
jgi:hypothetical protein